MAPVWHFEVGRSDLTQTRVVEASPLPLAEGQIRLRVDHFALTANNITYATMGDSMGYWRFYPAADAAWGRVPVWGFADVVETRHSEITVGERVYGYFPMGAEAILTPARVSAASFVESAPLRAELAAAYNLYMRCAVDPAHDPATEAYRALLMPLFVTSFLIDDMLAEADFFGASDLLITSASSKTAFALAFLLHHRAAPGRRVVGLTAPRNAPFAAGLGCYDLIQPYETITALDATRPALMVDFAGNGPLRNALHHHFADNMRFSLMVGLSHHGQRADMKGIPGAKPVLFFAPERLKKRGQDWGRDGLNARIAKSWLPFLAQAQTWLKVRRLTGPESFAPAWSEMLAGATPADTGVMLAIS